MNDEELAHFLGGEAPAPDASFRVDVFARIAHNGRRREARRQAITLVAAYTAVGVLVGLAQAFGFTVERAQPLLLVAAAAGLAYFAAMDAGKGSRSSLARWFTGLRFSRL